MTSFRAAAVQMNSQPDLDHNLETARHWIRKAAADGADLVGLPENFAFLGDEDERIQQAERISGSVEKALTSWAKEFGVCLLGGGYPVPASRGKVYNRAVLIDPDGETLAKYDKIHLFDVELSDTEAYRESDRVQPGDKKIALGQLNERLQLGLSICYDVRFPELYRKLAGEGAQILAVPSAFTRPTGKAHWEVLLRARAIENSAYVFAPAQTGKHGSKRRTYGHAMIIDPWGTVLADAGTEPGLAVAEIDPEILEKVRRKLPSLSHRVL